MIEKPGPHKKPKRPRIKPPAEKHCRRCNRTTGTEAWRHAESRLIKFEHGGGIMGGKLPDDQTSWLCLDCDMELSQPLPKDASQKDLEYHKKQWQKVIKLSHNDVQHTED